MIVIITITTNCDWDLGDATYTYYRLPTFSYYQHPHTTERA